MECDRIASATTAAMLGDGEIPAQPILSMPYEGSKAVFKIGRRWVTKDYKREIYRARRTKHIRRYCKERDGLTKRLTWSIGNRLGRLDPNCRCQVSDKR